MGDIDVNDDHDVTSEDYFFILLLLFSCVRDSLLRDFGKLDQLGMS